VSIIICDLDGTLFDHSERLKNLDTMDFDEYNGLLHMDPLKEPIAELVRAMRSAGHHIYFMTGRPERYRGATYDKLMKHGVIWDELFMRPDDCMDSDTTVKKAMFDRLTFPEQTDVLFVLEDRDCVVQLWRDLGLTCLQVERFEMAHTLGAKS
jgi:hypothetical protein